MKGKLIRRNLKIKPLTVAKLRLANLEKNQRHKSRSITAVHSGKMSFRDALNSYWKRLQSNPTTGLKGRHAGESHEILMVPDMRTLLEQHEIIDGHTCLMPPKAAAVLSGC